MSNLNIIIMNVKMIMIMTRMMIDDDEEDEENYNCDDQTLYNSSPYMSNMYRQYWWDQQKCLSKCKKKRGHKSTFTTLPDDKVTQRPLQIRVYREQGNEDSKLDVMWIPPALPEWRYYEFLSTPS